MFQKIIFLLLIAICCGACQESNTFRFERTTNSVRLYYDDQHITSYLFEDTLQKQCFYPLHVPSGKRLTRGFPLEKIRNESTDHPHHIGLWFAYGEVNGVDFWTSTWETYDGVSVRHGKIKHEEVTYEMLSSHTVVFRTASVWQSLDRDLLKEHTSTWFRVADDQLIVDRKTNLVAEDSIHFEDSKEGMYAIRVADFLRQDDSGVYRNSEGQTGDAVWGQKARWVILESEKEQTFVLFMDHQDNYPAYWMARGYGLFSANPLGRSVYENSPDSLNLQLAPGESVEFKYRIVLSERAVSSAEIENLFAKFQEQ